MNKLFTKIAALALGAAMVVGVGVSVTNSRTVSSAEAASVSFDATKDSGSGSITKDGITLSMSTMNRTQKDNFRANSGSDVTVSSSAGKMTKVEFTCTGSGTNNYGPGKMDVKSGSTGSYSYSGKVGTWTGNADSFIMTTTAQVRMTLVVVTYTSAGNLVSLSANSHGTLTGDTTIATGSGGTVTIVPDTGYKLPTSVTVSGATLSSYTSSTGAVVLTNVTGAVTVNATCPALETFNISVTASNCTYTGDSTIVEKTGTASITFTANVGFSLPNDVTVSNATKSSWTKSTGVLVISNATAAPSISVTANAVTLSSIQVSGGTTSFYYGHEFEHDSVIVTATYSDSSVRDVSNMATFSEPDMFSATEQNVTVTYTEGNVQKTTSYSISVNNKVPQAGSLAKITNISDLTVGSTVYLVCEAVSKELSAISTTSTKYGEGAEYATTINKVYALTVCEGNSQGSFAFQHGSNYLYWTTGNSLNVDSNLSDNTSWTVSINSGNATITNVAQNSRVIWWNVGSPRFACYEDKTDGDSYKYVQLYKDYPAIVKEVVKVDASYTGSTKYAGDSIAESDFTPYKTYDTGASSRVQITGSDLNNFVITSSKTLSLGDNDIAFSYTEDNVTVEGSYVYNAGERTSVLTGLTWAQGAYSVIDTTGIDFSRFGTVTAIYDNGESSATKSISSCVVALYAKSGDVYTKQANLSDGDTISSASHSGLYLGVSYSENDATFVAYSSAPLDIVEYLQPIRATRDVWSYSKATSFEIGDRIVFVNETNKTEPSGYNSSNKFLTQSEFTEGPSGDYYFEIESDGRGNYALHNPTDGYLRNTSTGATGNNYVYFASEIDTESLQTSWDIAFDENDNVIITSKIDALRTIRYNLTNTRFSCYGSGQLDIQLYKGVRSVEPYGADYANTNAVVQRAVLNFVNTMMSQDYLGSCSNSSSFDTTKWSGLKSAFTNADKGGDATLFVNMLKYAVAAERNAQGETPNGDTLQKALARYDLVIYRYNTSLGSDYDFLGRIEAGTAIEGGSLRVNSITSVFGESSATIAVVIVSIIGVSALGGFFFLRKRKEI